MSELYLVLRSRLEQVTDWVTLGQKVMREARTARGFSYETTARQLYVVSKTYERWEKRGQVPRQSVDLVAEVLGLEIEYTPAQRPIVRVAAAGDGALLSVMERVESRLTRLEEQVDELLASRRELPPDEAADEAGHAYRKRNVSDGNLTHTDRHS